MKRIVRVRSRPPVHPCRCAHPAMRCQAPAVVAWIRIIYRLRAGHLVHRRARHDDARAAAGLRGNRRDRQRRSEQDRLVARRSHAVRSRALRRQQGPPPILRWTDGGRGTCAAPTATCIRYGGGQIADFRGREMDLHVDPAGTCVGFGTASSRMRCLKGLKNPICTKTGG